MMKYAFLVLLLTSGFSAAQHPENCMPEGELDASLIDWYGERVVAELPGGDTVLWQNADSGSWTIVHYSGTGRGCVLGSGTDWPPNGNTAALVTQVVR